MVQVSADVQCCNSCENPFSYFNRKEKPIVVGSKMLNVVVVAAFDVDGFVAVVFVIVIVVSY